MEFKKKILVVDDEPAITELIKAYLSGTGRFEVQALNDSTLAVDAALAFLPHVILLDLMMPHMDGSEIAAKIQTEPALRDTQVLFLTGAVQEDEIAGSDGMVGGNFFIAKPVSLEKLLVTIDRYSS